MNDEQRDQDTLAISMLSAKYAMLELAVRVLIGTHPRPKDFEAVFRPASDTLLDQTLAMEIPEPARDSMAASRDRILGAVPKH